MGFFKKTQNNIDTSKDSEISTITESLYKQNLELAIKNKTLSLLRELYQISIQTLKEGTLADALMETMQTALGFELVATLFYDENEDSLTPFAFSRSEHWDKARAKLGIDLTKITLTKISTHSLLGPILSKRIHGYADNLSIIWGNEVDPAKLSLLEEAANVKATIIYPLLIEGDVIGVLLYSINRHFHDLPPYEQESLESFTDVVAVALDRSSLYEKLKTANEKLKELDKLKTEFLSLASHQLRSPLTATKGYLSMLSDGSFGQVTAEQKVAIDRVYESTEHLRKVVEDLLDVSKIEQGGMKFEMKEFDLTKSVTDVIDTLAINIKNKGLEIIKNIPDEPIIITGDSEKLRQVFINLIDNSLKYTEKGSLTIGIEEHSQLVRFSVRDTGMGITPEIMVELFKKFSRGIGGTVNAGGSGLGLYLAKEIVEAHHGRVWAESEGTGKGSIFIVELPLLSK